MEGRYMDARDAGDAVLCIEQLGGQPAQVMIASCDVRRGTAEQ